ncbi:MAG: hypothetical protein Q9210_004124 [Variospora velana]
MQAEYSLHFGPAVTGLRVGSWHLGALQSNKAAFSAVTSTASTCCDVVEIQGLKLDNNAWLSGCGIITQLCRSKTTMSPDQQLEHGHAISASSSSGSGDAMYSLRCKDTRDCDKTGGSMIEHFEIRTFAREQEKS